MVHDKRVFPVLLLITFFIAVSSCRTPEQAPNASAGPNTAADEAGIRAHIAGAEATLNKRDFAAYAARFVPDGDLIVVDGPTISGQDAIRRALEAAWANAPATRRIAITVEKIRSLGPDIAVVDDTARFSEGGPAPNRGTEVVVRRDGAWRTLVLRVFPAAKQ
jgi:uncharacterized protein (TIGR02246 family)